MEDKRSSTGVSPPDASRQSGGKNRALEKLDSQEAVTADGFSVKLPGQPADSTPNKAQEQPGVKEADHAQSDQVEVSAPIPTSKPLVKKRRISIFTEFLEKLHSTSKEKIKVKAVSKTPAGGPPQGRKLDDKALQQLLRGAPYQESSPALPVNTNPCTRRCWAVAVILVIVIAGVVIFLPLMWSRGVCETPVCRHYAMLLDDTISSTLPPCIDFHAHVCAGWERSHRISVIDNVYEQ
ncbi:hypothetical protein HPB51_013210 [Rhipicephalus microplus]|uniref:Uncharacterized protein n=1 Tax=Rhipicephalus microplus TaxID=6941 RepID=A0A9J6DMV4_RHIMP|nr:hypothetical protein HPB51_013210 [Rhipicephalus microplus]